jgi:hypothetical protein
MLLGDFGVVDSMVTEQAHCVKKCCRQGIFLWLVGGDWPFCSNLAPLIKINIL